MKKIIIVFLFLFTLPTMAQTDNFVGKWIMAYRTMGGLDYNTRDVMTVYNDNTYIIKGTDALFGKSFTTKGNWSINENEVTLQMMYSNGELQTGERPWVYLLKDNTLTLLYIVKENGEKFTFDIDKDGNKLEDGLKIGYKKMN